jgi:hypothetical protein
MLGRAPSLLGVGYWESFSSVLVAAGGFGQVIPFRVVGLGKSVGPSRPVRLEESVELQEPVVPCGPVGPRGRFGPQGRFVCALCFGFALAGLLGRFSLVERTFPVKSRFWRIFRRLSSCLVGPSPL